MSLLGVFPVGLSVAGRWDAGGSPHGSASALGPMATQHYCFVELKCFSDAPPVS